MRNSFVIVLGLLTLAIGANVCGAQPRIPDRFWDHGGRDFDDLYDPPPLPITYLATYDFEGCSTDGWTSHDRTSQGPFFHIDNLGSLTGYDPLTGAKSLWCGTRLSALSEPSPCNYADVGYGNNWDQRWITKECQSVTGTVTVTFTAKWDMEAGYDFAFVEYEYCDGGPWETANGTLGSPGITGTDGPSLGIFNIASHPGQMRIRLRVVTDSGYSDEDGDYDSVGAILIDDLRVDDAGGVVLPLENFEGEAHGATESNDWIAQSASFGDYAGIVSGSTQPQDDPWRTNLSCLWAFTVGPTNTYSCGYGTTAGVPAGPIDDNYIFNEIWSPTIVFSGPTSYGTFLKFDVYRHLPLDNLVFYTWHVRERLMIDSCWEAWKNDNTVYHGEDAVWRTHQVDMTPSLSPASDIVHIQVALGVIDYFPIWAGTFGSGSCHTHAPLFDNVSVFRYPGRSHVAYALTIFQDRFPSDGTLGGTVRMDGAEGDALRLQIRDAAADIDYFTPNVPASGPAVFLHVKNIGNKAGAVVSGGPLWPQIPSMSDQTWTVLQMAETGEPHEYSVDLNDQLYNAGDVIEYYVSSRTTTGEWSYWSYFTGTASESDVKTHPMEVTGLPTPPQQGIARALYIDGYSGLGAEPLIEDSMKMLGLEWDRFDRSEPLMALDNSVGNLMSNPEFLSYYEFILWNVGDLSNPFTDADYALMAYYLSATPGARLFISGSHAAKAIATSSDPAAELIRTDFLNFTLVTDDHRSLGLPLSPTVTGAAQSPFTEDFVAFVEEGSLGKFDVIAPAGSSVLGMEYDGVGNAGALIYQETPMNMQAVSGPEPARVVLSTVSLHAIRDDEPAGIPVRTSHLDQVLTEIGSPGSPPTNVPRVADDHLSQNHPNPFNPTTTIEYASSVAGPLTLRIYDVSGRLVRTLLDKQRAPVGSGRVEWDGRDDMGVAVASGVYFYRLSSPKLTTTKKMVLLK